MAKTRTIPNPASSKGTKKKRRNRRNNNKNNNTNIPGADPANSPSSPEDLYLGASELFYQLQIDQSLPLAQRCLRCFQETYPDHPAAAAPALLLLGQIYLAHGDADASRAQYLKAAEVDADGGKAGAAAFLWCAQLSEEGGADSIRWFEKGCTVLRAHVTELEESLGTEGEEVDEVQLEIEDVRRQLGEALCSMAEVYMTDLSFDPDAGFKCNALMTEALLVSPHSPSVLQTLASVRISDQRIEDAKAALSRSMELWNDLPAADSPAVPDFATRISLTRLLVEVGMETEAIAVVDQLVQEDDESVEACYLGAWSRFLLYEKDGSPDTTAVEARDWFRKCLRLCAALGYEDERLRVHAVEVAEKLDRLLGEPSRRQHGGEGKEDDEAEWEDEDGDGEEEDQQGLEDEVEIEAEEDDPPDVTMS